MTGAESMMLKLALLLVVELAALVTTTEYVPTTAGDTLLTVRLVVIVPVKFPPSVIFVPSNCH